MARCSRPPACSLSHSAPVPSSGPAPSPCSQPGAWQVGGGSRLQPARPRTLLTCPARVPRIMVATLFTCLLHPPCAENTGAHAPFCTPVHRSLLSQSHAQAPRHLPAPAGPAARPARPAGAGWRPAGPQRAAAPGTACAARPAGAAGPSRCTPAARSPRTAGGRGRGAISLGAMATLEPSGPTHTQPAEPGPGGLPTRAGRAAWLPAVPAAPPLRAR